MMLTWDCTIGKDSAYQFNRDQTSDFARDSVRQLFDVALSRHKNLFAADPQIFSHRFEATAHVALAEPIRYRYAIATAEPIRWLAVIAHRLALLRRRGMITPKIIWHTNRFWNQWILNFRLGRSYFTARITICLDVLVPVIVSQLVVVTISNAVPISISITWKPCSWY